MKIPRDIEELMRRLGLTQNEIKVYILLLNTGPLTAKEISDYGEVPFSKVYLVLKSLEDKGWVSLLRGRPLKYVALSPDDAVKKAKVHREKEWEEAAGKVLPILKPLYEARVISEAPEVWIVRGEENVSSRVIDLVLKSHYELLMALHAKIESLFEKVQVIDKTMSSYIPAHIKILIPRDLVSEVECFRRFGAELRYREAMFGGGVISDTREALLLLGESNKISAAIWSNHSSLIYLAKLYFEKLWESSKKIEV